MQKPIHSEADERTHLQTVRARIRAELDSVMADVDDRSADLKELKTYLSENKSDMDHIEKVSGRQTVDELSRVGEHGALGAQRLFKLLKSPYFGRLDFQPAATSAANLVYIGIHSFYDSPTKTYLVHDWRAPISSMFYDFEHDAAHYQAPAGLVRGDILPFCDAKTYHTVIDKHMLYVGVTRAMHRLTLTHTGRLTPLLAA